MYWCPQAPLTARQNCCTRSFVLDIPSIKDMAFVRLYVPAHLSYTSIKQRLAPDCLRIFRFDLHIDSILSTPDLRLADALHILCTYFCLGRGGVGGRGWVQFRCDSSGYTISAFHIDSMISPCSLCNYQVPLGLADFSLMGVAHSPEGRGLYEVVGCASCKA